VEGVEKNINCGMERDFMNVLTLKTGDKISPPYYKFGRRIRRFRHVRDMNQIELSSALGVHRITVVRWEAGETCPTVEQLPLLADVLGVDVSWLFGDDWLGKRGDYNEAVG
jgi:ribosome-binding protein aMBF1 (putative translation factor)